MRKKLRSLSPLDLTNIRPNKKSVNNLFRNYGTDGMQNVYAWSMDAAFKSFDFVVHQKTRWKSYKSTLPENDLPMKVTHTTKLYYPEVVL